MGAECSVDRMNNLEEIGKENGIKDSDKNKTNNVDMNTIQNFDFLSYKEYYLKMEVFTKRLQEIMKIIEMLNNFHLPKNQNIVFEKIENSYYGNMSMVKMEKLYEVKIKLIFLFLL